MSSTYDVEKEFQMQEEEEETRNLYRKPTKKELDSCRPCRILLIVLFALALIGLLIGAIIWIVKAEKCTTHSSKSNLQTNYVTYQVYVKSFMDSNQDGSGDLRGLSSKLDYIKGLGMNTIILSDVISTRNFGIDSKVGSMEDFKSLVSLLKEKNMFVVLEFNPIVLTEESNWLKNDSTKFDWFIWNNNKNVWKNREGKSAWYKSGDMYYYSYYGEGLLTLNYRNKAVVAMVKERLLSWIQMNITGVVLTDVSRLIVNGNLSTSDLNTDQDQAYAHEILHELYELINSNQKALWVSPGTSVKNSVQYFGSVEKPESDIVINNEIGNIQSPIDTLKLKQYVMSFETIVPKHGMYAWTAGDVHAKRIASRMDEKNAALFNLFLLMLPQNVIVMYGDELSLPDNDDSDRNPVMYWGDNTEIKNSSLIAKKPIFDAVYGFTNLSKIRSSIGKHLMSSPTIVTLNSVISIQYGDKFLVMINFAANTVSVTPANSTLNKGDILFSTNAVRLPNFDMGNKFTMQPYEMFLMKANED